MSKRLDDLDPRFRPVVERGLALLVERGIPHLLYCTGRTAAEQADCHARGASRCDGVKIKSKHQLGLAADIIALNSAGVPTWDYRRYADRYKAIAAVMREVGAEVGADWYPSEYSDVGLGWDPPHSQYKP